MDVICNVDTHAEVTHTLDPLEVSQRRSDYLADHVKHPEVIYERTLWRVQPAEKRAELMRKQAQKAGMVRRLYADEIEREGDL